MLKYLNDTIDNELTLNIDCGVGTVQWYVDASFAVHLDLKKPYGCNNETMWWKSRSRNNKN